MYYEHFEHLNENYPEFYELERNFPQFEHLRGYGETLRQIEQKLLDNERGLQEYIQAVNQYKQMYIEDMWKVVNDLGQLLKNYQEFFSQWSEYVRVLANKVEYWNINVQVQQNAAQKAYDREQLRLWTNKYNEAFAKGQQLQRYIQNIENEFHRLRKIPDKFYRD